MNILWEYCIDMVIYDLYNFLKVFLYKVKRRGILNYFWLLKKIFLEVVNYCCVYKVINFWIDGELKEILVFV